MIGKVRRIGPRERVSSVPVPGITREEAVAAGLVTAALVRTEAGMRSGWHHHGDHETVIYVLSGLLQIEFGSSAEEALEADPGDFVYIGRWAVHRDGNPKAEEATIIVFRAGTGQVIFDVDGPQS